MKEAWTLTPLTYSIVHSTCIIRVPARRVSGPYACVIIRVNSGFTYVNVLYMRMHGWACRYCKLRSRTARGRTRMCAYARFVSRCILPCNYTCSRENNRIFDKYRSRSCIHTQMHFSFVPRHFPASLFNQEIDIVLM